MGLEWTHFVRGKEYIGRQIVPQYLYGEHATATTAGHNSNHIEKLINQLWSHKKGTILV